MRKYPPLGAALAVGWIAGDPAPKWSFWRGRRGLTAGSASRPWLPRKARGPVTAHLLPDSGSRRGGHRAVRLPAMRPLSRAAVSAATTPGSPGFSEQRIDKLYPK
jgi:hypothetical protein